MGTPVRVLIVDGEALFRRGLTMLFDKDPDVAVVGQARNGIEALEQARAFHPTIVLTELALPHGSGLTVARAIVRELPDVRIAVIARAFSRLDLIEAARSGVHGYLSKDTTVAQLVDAVKRISRGETIICATSSALMIEELAASSGGSAGTAGRPIPLGAARRPDGAHVTKREREVLGLIVQGSTNRDIGRRLVITENTVKVHLRNILDKLHVRNRQQAAAYAVNAGLVTMYAALEDPSDDGHDPASIPWRPRRAS